MNNNSSLSPSALTGKLDELLLEWGGRRAHTSKALRRALSEMEPRQAVQLMADLIMAKKVRMIGP